MPSWPASACPSVHEDDAIRAARAAVGVREALVTLNAERGSELRVRTGICTGPVVAGVGPDLPTLVTGDTVNVAARLEQAAAPGETCSGRRRPDSSARSPSSRSSIHSPYVADRAGPRRTPHRDPPWRG